MLIHPQCSQDQVIAVEVNDVKGMVFIDPLVF